MPGSVVLDCLRQPHCKRGAMARVERTKPKQTLQVLQRPGKADRSA
jgi:hypothetical protein